MSQVASACLPFGILALPALAARFPCSTEPRAHGAPARVTTINFINFVRTRRSFLSGRGGWAAIEAPFHAAPRGVSSAAGAGTSDQ